MLENPRSREVWCFSQPLACGSRQWDASEPLGLGFSNTTAWLDLNPYTNVSALPCYSHSIFTVRSKFIMNYKLTFFKAWYHGKAPTCARLSYMKLKLNNRAFQKCMVELAPQYETDQPSGSRTKRTLKSNFLPSCFNSRPRNLLL